MSDRELIPEGMEHVAAQVEQFDGTVEQTDPGENHKELMEMLGGLFIQTSRIYDVLMAMLPDEVESELDKVHESGRLMFSPPTLLENGWDADDPAQ